MAKICSAKVAASPEKYSNCNPQLGESCRRNGEKKQNLTRHSQRHNYKMKTTSMKERSELLTLTSNWELVAASSMEWKSDPLRLSPRPESWLVWRSSKTSRVSEGLHVRTLLTPNRTPAVRFSDVHTAHLLIWKTDNSRAAQLCALLILGRGSDTGHVLIQESDNHSKNRSINMSICLLTILVRTVPSTCQNAKDVKKR